MGIFNKQLFSVSTKYVLVYDPTPSGHYYSVCGCVYLFVCDEDQRDGRTELVFSRVDCLLLLRLTFQHVCVFQEKLYCV